MKLNTGAIASLLSTFLRLDFFKHDECDNVEFELRFQKASLIIPSRQRALSIIDR